MSLTFYANLVSQPSRAVALFLKVNNIPHEFKFVDMVKGEHTSEVYEKLNPFKKVPIIDDNGFILRESVGILRYLCRERNVPDHWYPKDSKQQARVDEYLEWQHLDTRASCAMFVQIKLLIPKITGIPADPEKVKKIEKRMKNTLSLIENIWLKDKPYLTGDKISIADLLGACEVEQPRMAGYDARKDFPRIAAWLERVRNDLNPHYDEVHKAVGKIAAKSKL
ncbi:glutathione S-transferase theta-1-like isoform X2 [Periplaneta americana]|uniref:glutathione S-transferase theta-1-like isoform X2 n=1 Tax=Periplaneta americana TaxID=6978 RepID=UPI0037E8BC3F